MKYRVFQVDVIGTNVYVSPSIAEIGKESLDFESISLYRQRGM